MALTLDSSPLIAGAACGLALVSDQPLSFWGGYDGTTGEIIDRRHPLSGRIAAGCILCVPFSRGSSTTTAVLLEAIKNGVAPAALVTTQRDFFFALAAVAAEETFALSLPVFVLAAADFAQLRSDLTLIIDAAGLITSPDQPPATLGCAADQTLP
jgi:predicted aconitase with swiveling domain